MLYFILTAVFSVAVALFALQNAQVVTLSFFFWSFQQSLVVTILLSFILGLLVASLFMLAMKTKHFLESREIKDEILSLQQKNSQLIKKLAAYEAKEQMEKSETTQQGNDNKAINQSRM